MDITITIPDTLIPTMDTWRATQITDDGLFFKYADTQDLIQQNLNTGLLPFFVDLLEAPEIAALQAQINTIEASVSLPPSKPPVPVSE